MRFTKKEFRAWLEANQTRIVGTPTGCRCCPIANFLHENGSPKANVGFHTYSLDEQHLDNRLPVWAKKFIRAVDVRERPVRGKTALKILNSI